MSPDGRTIACTVATADFKANRVKTEIWLVPAGEGELKKLAFETEAIERILWSPQGNLLAVVGAIAGEGTHLWVVEPANEKSRRVTRTERSNHYLAHQGANLCWSP